MGGSDSSDLDGECAFDERTASSSSTDLSGSPASSSATSSSPSGSDDERECHVDHVAPFRTISDRMYATAGSLGPGARTYAALESLPWDQRGGRLVHFDIVHSEFRTAARPLRGGITSYLVGIDVGAGYAFFRALKGPQCIGKAYRELAVQQQWHVAQVPVHVVSDGESALVHHLEAAALGMGQSFETLPPYSPNANFAGSNLVQKLRTAVRGYILGAARQPGSVIDGSFEPFAWQQAGFFTMKKWT